MSETMTDVIIDWEEDKEVKAGNPRDRFTWEDVNVYI